MYNPVKISSNFFTTHRKGTAKFTAKIEKYVYYIFTESGSFLETCINVVEQRLKFPHFEGSIIP